MRSILHKLRFVWMATLCVGTFTGLIFWLEHKMPPSWRITLCWAALLPILALLEFASNEFKRESKRFSPIRLASTISTMYMGLGMVHFLRGDDIGATLFTVFSLIILLVGFLFWKFSHRADSDSTSREMTKL